MLKYLDYPLWQLPLMALFLVGWLLGGAYLIQRLFKAHTTRRTSAYAHCVKVSFLSGGAAWLAAGAVYVLIITIAERYDTTYNYLGLIPAVLTAVAMFYLVLHASFDLPMSVVAPRSGIVVGAIILLGLAVAIGVFLPAQSLLIRQVRRNKSVTNVFRINAAVDKYEKAFAKPPSSLGALVDSNTIEPRDLQCPSVPDRKIGYFYLPVPTLAREQKGDKLRLCEFTTDETKPGRIVLFATGQVLRTGPADFERLLGLEDNRLFAEKFRQADKPK